MLRNQLQLFQDPHIDYPIGNLNLSFADYIKQNKEIITRYRMDLDQNKDLIVDANVPFELRPSQPINSEKNPGKIKYGALLIHGLLDSPFIMKDIGKQLQSQGLLVRSILLPGHGTVPGSLLNVKYEDWLQAVRYGIATLRNEVDQIYIVGFSTGAILSLYHTLQNPEQIAGLIMFSPAFKINSSFDFATNLHTVISWAWSRARWLLMDNEIDYIKYSSMAANAVYQVYRLTAAIKKLNHSVQPPCPVFIALSYDDLTVSSPTTIKYFQFYSNPNNKMILYSKKPKQFNDSRIITRHSVYPEWNIISFSHISIPIARDNPHYGIHGDYPLASHVDEKSNCVYGALDKPHRIFYDLLYKLKLTHYQHRRLTFNPDFEFMAQQIKKFLNGSYSR